MSIAAGSLPCCQRAAKLRKNLLEIGREQLEAFSFRARGEEFLLEIKLERQRPSKMERKLARSGSGKILHRPGQRQDFKMKLRCSGACFLRCAAGIIRNE